MNYPVLFSTMDLQHHLSLVKDFVVAAGDRANAEIYNTMQTKDYEGSGDISTNLDGEIEREFHEFVMNNFPEHGFQGEEFPELYKKAEYVWQIDPIDGTKYYAKAVPLWSVTVSLVHRGEPILGIVYNPPTKQLHSAIKGQGAFLNGQQIRFKPAMDLEKMQGLWDSLTFPHLKLAYNNDIPVAPDDLIGKYPDPEEFFHKLNAGSSTISSKIYRLRAIGNGSLSLAWLAQGGFTLYICPCRLNEKIVDLNAGLLIASEAGAEVYQRQLGKDLMQVIVGPADLIPEVTDWLDL